MEAVLRHWLAGQAVNESIIALARNDYGKLSRPTAQRTLRFMQIRETAR